MFGKPIAHKKMISALELLPQLDSKIEYTEITAHWVSHVLFIYLFIYLYAICDNRYLFYFP